MITKSRFLMFLCINCIFQFCIQAEQTTKKEHVLVGFNSGFAQQETYMGDIFGGYSMLLGSNVVEANVGYATFKRSTRFDGVDNLWYTSHGLFCEFNYYYTSGLFVGARLMLNYNFVNEASQQWYKDNNTKDPPVLFPGIAPFGQLGYNWMLHKSIALRIKGKVGLHNYQIQTGSLYFSNDTSPIPAEFSDRYAKEMQLKWLYDIGVGMVVYI